MSASAVGAIDTDFQSIFESSLDAIFIFSGSGRIINANRTATRRYGYDLDELKSMTAADMAAGVLKASAAAKFGQLMRSGEIFEWAHECKDGRHIPVEIFAQSITLHGEQVLLSHVRDITQRKQAEEEREMFVSLANNSKEFIGMADLNFTPFYVNQAALALVGLPNLDAVRKLKVQDFFFPEDREFITHDFFPRVLREGNAEVEIRFRHFQTGAPIWMLYNVFLIHDLRGDAAGWATVSRNITDRKHAEGVLQVSEQRFRNYMDNAPTIAWMKDADGRYVYLSGAYERRFDVTTGDWLGKTDFDRWPPEIAEKLRRTDASALQENRTVEVVEQTLNPDGSSSWWRNFNFPFRDATGAAFVGGIGLDITEQTASEGKIRRLTRLYAALGHCNQAIVRCTSADELFPQVCRDTVEFGGMEMAWIGLVDPVSSRVEPVASFGKGIAYLDGLEISVAAHLPAGTGPTGTSIRENHPCWCQDFQHDASTAAWRERGRQFGWRASAALPLHRRGVAIGAMTLYTGTENAFDESAQNLLIKISMDISAALDRFDSEAQHMKDEEDLRLSEQHLRTIIETEPECVTLVDQAGRILEINPAGLAVLELRSLSGQGPFDLQQFILPAYHAAFDALRRRLLQGELATMEFEMVGLQGTRRWLEMHAAPMRDASGGVSAILGVVRDVTESKCAQERIQYLANFDALTGLPNRTQLADHLKYALSLAKRNNSHLALMFIDLDRFKDINDTLGHSVGDAVLIEVARRLRLALREVDTASRLGGDEFIVVLADDDARGATQVAEKLLRVIAEPYRIAPYDLMLTASIGISLFPDDGLDFESLSRSADTAMYRAKNEGRDRYCFFTVEMQAEASRNMQLVTALHHALDRGQLQVHYQPLVSIRDGVITGVEALLRWDHPQLGPIAPSEFIPVAEDSGLILPIGEWVLRSAVRQLKRWIARGHPPMAMAVNLSAVQFRHPRLPEIVSRILSEEQVPPNCLELELTEGVAMQDPQSANALIRTLTQLGVRFSIDDFGTGYSSLNYLKRFKVFKLKIDQSFVRDIGTDMEDRAIVAAVISMARNLGLKTIAEGVETAEQLAILRGHGCDEAQGYFYSKPLPADEIEALLGRACG